MSLKPHGLKAEGEYRWSDVFAVAVDQELWEESTGEDPTIYEDFSYDFLQTYTIRGFAIQIKRFYDFMMKQCGLIKWTSGCGLRVRNKIVDHYGNFLFDDYCPARNQKCSLLTPDIEWKRDTCPAWKEYRDLCETDIEFSFLKEYLEQSRLEDDTPMLIPQVWIEPKGALGYDKRFRVDFAMFVRDVSGAWQRYAIEIKGSKYHSEKLVEDAQRERALAYMGYHVISFWEPEVATSRYKVVKELFTLVNL